jgi:DNA-binding NarL/FixJ family response regulator
MKTSMKTEPTKESRESLVKVLVVEDHPIFREHLMKLVTQDLGMSICGEADNVQLAKKLIEETHPDIALVDIGLRGPNGLELIKDCKARGIDLKILVISMHEESLYAERALRAGARGYITKNRASAEVVEAIRCVLQGEAYVSGRMASKLLDLVNGRTRKSTGVESLADRELEVFCMLGRGMSTREIARSLNLADATVDTYRGRIKEKLGLRSASELYLHAGAWVRDRVG